MLPGPPSRHLLTTDTRFTLFADAAAFIQTLLDLCHTALTGQHNKARTKKRFPRLRLRDE